MSLASLTRYRKIIMVLGFSIFAAGAVYRMYAQRRLGSSAGHGSATTTAERPRATPAELWRNECHSYACRDIHLDEPGCARLCSSSLVRGLPTMKPERIATACISKCEGDGEAGAACESACFIQSSKELARANRH
jgi:hypothetical protein